MAARLAAGKVDRGPNKQPLSLGEDSNQEIDQPPETEFS